MGLVKEQKLTADFVLDKIDEAEIFSAYFGEFSFKKTYPSVFRRDRNPSTGFYINKSGKIIYNDIATGEKLDCFAFVAKSFNLTYGGAVYKVACDFGLIDCGDAKILSKRKIKKAEIATEEIKKETVIEITPDSWTPGYLKFWEELSISQQELEPEKVYPVRKLFINGKLIPNYSKDIRYAYIVEANGKSYKKIYTPYAEGGKFKWITNIPLYIPFGIDSLPLRDDRVIVTKSQKDRILLKKFFSDVIATQNESPSAMTDKTIAWLDKRYRTKIINYDCDEAGLRSSQYFINKGFTPLFVPDIAYQKHGIKDFADFVKHYGLPKLEAYFKYLNLI